jgi:RNA polymerase sigma-70 factor (ECF subfamily)
MLDNEEEQAKIADIYINYRPVMLRKALSLVKNKEMAEDAVHNVILAVIMRKEKFFSLASQDLRVQLIIITKNKCIDILRQRNPFVDNQIDEMGDILVANDIPVEDQIILDDEYSAIKRYLAQIDEASRLVLEMKYIMGMTYKEIGKDLGMTPKHVETKIMRAKEKVRKLDAKGGTEDEC